MPPAQPPNQQSNRPTRLWEQWAAQDVLLILYLTIFLVALALSPSAPARSEGLVQVGAFAAVLLPVQFFARSHYGRNHRLGAVLYIVATYCTIQVSYFFLGIVLPQINPGNLDRALFHFDLRWFGLEPSLALAPWASTSLSEWFAFFYFCYFFILVLHAALILFGTRDDRLRSEYLLGIGLVFCTGQLLYAVVPGFGPFRALATDFKTQFYPAVWVDLVLKAVATGGAQKDIFPSIHTAAPTFLSLLSFRHRHRLPFGFSWWLVWLFSVNIVVATLFLRWHWIIDVSCGLLLAVFAFVATVVVTEWDLRRRARRGLGPIVPVP